jgi:hypothetical protein
MTQASRDLLYPENNINAVRGGIARKKQTRIGIPVRTLSTEPPLYNVPQLAVNFDHF